MYLHLYGTSCSHVNSSRKKYIYTLIIAVTHSPKPPPPSFPRPSYSYPTPSIHPPFYSLSSPTPPLSVTSPSPLDQSRPALPHSSSSNSNPYLADPSQNLVYETSMPNHHLHHLPPWPPHHCAPP